MRNIVKDIEQLEVAGDLIDKNTPTTSRLALFLIDNFAELIMYRRALYEFAHDDQWKTMRSSKYSSEKRKDIKNHLGYALHSRIYYMLCCTPPMIELPVTGSIETPC